ncbi:EF-P beta-lysylation protein EpmB [Planctomycetales bacterium]|nr:EF-P beta-lysylation protein EpmB [Planctomycetales bacterium]
MTINPEKNADWQTELSQAFTSAGELCRELRIPPVAEIPGEPLFVPRSFVARMQQGNPNDPLLLQVLPQQEELKPVDGFSNDPLGEETKKHSGLLQKYPRRALMLTTNACGIHCRFCFRRHTKKDRSSFSTKLKSLPSVLSALPSIEEIILSGGDPLMLNDNELNELCRQITMLPNIKRLRIHSRLPMVLPNRITPQLNRILDLPIPVYLVLHINHPNEINEAFIEKRQLLRAPVLMAQTVLLRSINDNTDTLDKLFTALADLAIIPYYLHQLDKVAGAAHFEVPVSTGIKIINELNCRLPGYAVPKYVREVNGLLCKEKI